jgi:hypothetical protein
MKKESDYYYVEGEGSYKIFKTFSVRG